MQNVYITDADGKMFVHEICGICFITWVSKENKDKALKFPADQAVDWCKVIENISGVVCQPTTPLRPGML